MSQQAPVTVQHGGVEITTNTASEADLRAELTRDDTATDTPTPEPAKGDATQAKTPAPRARDDQGRFVTNSEQTPVAEPATPPAEPAAPASETPQRRRDDTTPRHNPILRMNQALAQKAEAE